MGTASTAGWVAVCHNTRRWRSLAQQCMQLRSQLTARKDRIQTPYKRQEQTTASTGRKTQPVTAADTINCKDSAAAVVLRHSSSSPTHKAYQPTLLEDSALLNSVQLNCKLVGRQDLSLAATFPAGTHAQAKPPLSPSSATDVHSKCA